MVIRKKKIGVAVCNIYAINLLVKKVLTNPQFLQWCLRRRNVKGSLHEQHLSISESGTQVGGAKTYMRHMIKTNKVDYITTVQIHYKTYIIARSLTKQLLKTDICLLIALAKLGYNYVACNSTQELLL